MGVAENTDLEGAGAGHAAASPARALSPDQLPATKADLYEAVDALRADMRELMDMVQKLIEEADRRVTDLEHAKATGPAMTIGASGASGESGAAGAAGASGAQPGHPARPDDDEW